MDGEIDTKCFLSIVDYYYDCFISNIKYNIIKDFKFIGFNCIDYVKFEFNNDDENKNIVYFLIYGLNNDEYDVPSILTYFDFNDDYDVYTSILNAFKVFYDI